MELLTNDDKIEAARQEFFRRIENYKDYSSNLIIDSPEKHQEADQKVREGQRLKAGIKEKVDPIVKERHEAHKESTKCRSACLDPIEQGQKQLTDKMATYQKEEAEKAAKERERLEAEAKKRHEENCLKEAAELEAKGQTEAAESVLDFAEDLQHEIYVPEPDIRSKTKFDQGWDVEIVDELAVPEDYIIRTVNIKAIKEIVKQKKGNIKIPGIKIIPVTKTRKYK